MENRASVSRHHIIAAGFIGGTEESIFFAFSICRPFKASAPCRSIVAGEHDSISTNRNESAGRMNNFPQMICC